MNALTVAAAETAALRPLIERAATSLANAASAAEVLDARDQATLLYDAAKAAARLRRMRGAHDDVLATVYRLQADALEIESGAKRRLAEEYDAAQNRGEVAGYGGARGNQYSSARVALPTTGDLGISRTEIFEARFFRDAIDRDPLIIRRILDDILANGDQPTKANLRREMARALQRKRPKTAKALLRVFAPSDPIARLHWYEIDDEIRRSEATVRVLRAIKAHGNPADDRLLISEIIGPAALVAIRKEIEA